MYVGSGSSESSVSSLSSEGRVSSFKSVNYSRKHGATSIYDVFFVFGSLSLFILPQNMQ